MSAQYEFSGPVTVFHERRLPEQAMPAGYAVLIDTLRLRVPIPFRLLRQNDGQLSNRARDGEFSQLTAGEVTRIEAIYADASEGGST